MNIFLVRHGESIGNKERIIFGKTDYDLTETGIKQAEMLNEKLKGIEFDICYTSTLSRAYLTAAICLGREFKNVIKTSDLNEQNLGIYEGVKIDDIKENHEDIGRFFQEITYLEIENGESYENMFLRINRFLEKIYKQHFNDENILIVSHTGPLRILAKLLLKLDDIDSAKFYLEPGRYALIKGINDGFELKEFNI